MKVFSSSKPKVFFENLDGVRFLAFLFVFLSHTLKPGLKSLHLNRSFLGRLLELITSGGIGVSIFFVLSGFLITYLLLVEEKVKGKINVLFFYVRRVLRIWPLYYVVIVIALIAYPFYRLKAGLPPIHPNNPSFYFLFLSNFDVINSEHVANVSVSALEGITWSVAIEEQFYLIWPLLFVFIKKSYWKIIFLATILVSILFRTWHYNDQTALYYHSLSVCSDLAIGGLFAYIILWSEKFKILIQKMSRKTIVLIYILGFIYLLYLNSLLGNFAAALIGRIIQASFFAFVILEQNYSQKSFYKFSRNKLFTFWGKYTYGLYLLHPMAIFLLEVLFKRLNFEYQSGIIKSLIFSAIALILSLLLSYFSYEFFEKQFLKLKDRFSLVKNKTVNSNPDIQKFVIDGKS